MLRTTPENVGIKPQKIKEFIEVLEKTGLSTHDIIIARGGKVAFETYWKPFHKDRLHRMYSVSKSFVSGAVGFLIGEGKLSLSDKIVDLLPGIIDKVNKAVSGYKEKKQAKKEVNDNIEIVD